MLISRALQLRALCSPISRASIIHLTQSWPPGIPLSYSLQMAPCIRTLCCSPRFVIKCEVLRNEQDSKTHCVLSVVPCTWKVAGETHKTSFISSIANFTLGSTAGPLLLANSPPNQLTSSLGSLTVDVQTLFYQDDYTFPSQVSGDDLTSFPLGP